MSLVALARCIKERRLALNITLEEVASRTGLTRSVLSKVENFRVTPSLPALAKIAEALETTISELTREVGEPSEVSIVRRGEGFHLKRDQPKTEITYELLAHKSSGAMESILLLIPAAAGREEPLFHEGAHDGEEFLYVVKGQVRLDYNGKTYELSEGDSIHFNASILHRISNPGETPTTALCTYGAV
jgi:transcriptional regulator with XRE-family HTH domain